MNKAEFIRAVSDKAGITQKDIAAVYEAMVEVVTETLKEGEKIQLVGLGNIELKDIPAKVGLNPKTKAAVNIPACKRPVCKFGEAFRARFN